MTLAFACLVVFLWMGSDKLGLTGIAAILGSIVVVAAIVMLKQWPWHFLGAFVAVVDACLMLKVFGADIRIR